MRKWAERVCSSRSHNSSSYAEFSWALGVSTQQDLARLLLFFRLTYQAEFLHTATSKSCLKLQCSIISAAYPSSFVWPSRICWILYVLALYKKPDSKDNTNQMAASIKHQWCPESASEDLRLHLIFSESSFSCNYWWLESQNVDSVHPNYVSFPIIPCNSWHH